MRKPPSKSVTSAEDNIWGDQPPAPTPAELTEHKHHPLAEPPQATAFKAAPRDPDIGYDMEGLMTDFPTATDLERFVFDATGVVLTLKGRANKIKYQVALDVLNGVEVDEKFMGNENPYIDKADMVPTEEIREPAARDPSIPSRDRVQNNFHSRHVPHPDPDYRAKGKKCDVTFRKYDNGMITYEILGPIEPRPFGEKIDKFGRVRPEVIKWVDPRSGEQVVQRVDGSLTPIGKRLKGLLQLMRANNSNFWDVWVDRDFISLDRSVINNPWSDER